MDVYNIELNNVKRRLLARTKEITKNIDTYNLLLEKLSKDCERITEIYGVVALHVYANVLNLDKNPTLQVIIGWKPVKSSKEDVNKFVYSLEKICSKYYPNWTKSMNSVTTQIPLTARVSK